MLKIRGIIAALMLISVLFVVVDGRAATDSVDAKTALEQRVLKYWTARQTRDVRTLYDLESASLPGDG